MLNEAASNSILTGRLFKCDHTGTVSVGQADSAPPKYTSKGPEKDAITSK